jgi:isopropylmalate/homocitrate/citramalate synthase
MRVDVTHTHANLPKRVDVIDCTLRDGEQTPGVWFTLEEKIHLARLLSEAGMSVLDAGYPASSGADREALQEMHRLRLSARIGATARPVAGDVAAADEARVDEVFLFMPTSELRLKETLGITRERANRIFREGAEEVLARGMTLNLVLEDATRADPAQLIRLVEGLRPHVSIERLVICDTVGCAHPAGMQLLIETLDQAFDRQVVLCTHTHNDFGLAGANTLAGVAGGARAITCTVNGIGERAGNADLAECVAALTHLYEVAHGVEPRALPALSRAVERMSGIHMSATKPVTGFNVFRHESGIHVDGMLKNSLSYEFLPSAWIARRSEYVLGKHSGTSLIRHVLAQAGIECDAELAKKLLEEVKRETDGTDKAEHERAFIGKEDFARRALAGIDPSVVVARGQLLRAAG